MQVRIVDREAIKPGADLFPFATAVAMAVSYPGRSEIWADASDYMESRYRVAAFDSDDTVAGYLFPDPEIEIPTFLRRY